MNNGNKAYVYAFSIIAIFVLFIACINFMNLSTASSACRAKEVGVRKALGAHRSNLVHQFFSETFVLSFISFVISLGLVELALPFFRSLTGSELGFNYTIMPRLILGYLGLVSFVAYKRIYQMGIAGQHPRLADCISCHGPLAVEFCISHKNRFGHLYFGRCAGIDDCPVDGQLSSHQSGKSQSS